MTDHATLGEQAAEWLEKQRGIPVEVAAENGVVTVNGNLAFEYRLDGRLQYRKIRIVQNGEKSFVRDRKGSETCMYREDLLQSDPDLSSPLVICEGEIDALSLVAAGVPNVVSVPDGAQLQDVGEGKIIPTDDKAFGWLWDGDGLKPHLAQFERVIIATDADRKGRILREELAVRFERWKCDYVSYPDGLKDANEVLVAKGAGALRDLLTNVKPLVPNKLVAFGDLPDTETGEIFPSGFGGLDDQLRFSMVAPELMIVTGDPGSGKSEFTVCMGANLANYCGLPGAILQFEDRSNRVFETLSRYAIGHVASVGNRSDARDWVDKWFRTIEPEQNISDEVDYDFDWLRAVLREARVRHGCKWVILDPWNELDHMWDRTQNEATYTNDALRKLKRITRS